MVKRGGLHTEKAALRPIGTWLAGSGWVQVLSQAEITKAGGAESLINCAHNTRTRYAHQVNVQHVQRATYQGGQVWGQSTVPMPRLPHPEEWG